MARRTQEERVNMFSEEDQKFFLAIVRKTIQTFRLPEKFKELKEDELITLRDFVKAGIKKRFGNSEVRGLLHENIIEDYPDSVDLELKAGRPVKFMSVKNVPFNAKELISRLESQGHNWRKITFGVSIGNMSTTKFNGMIVDMVAYLMGEFREVNAFYNPEIERKKFNVSKKEKHSQDEYEQRSYGDIPLDDSDRNYLNEVELKLKRLGYREKQIKGMQAIALAVLYSDHFFKTNILKISYYGEEPEFVLNVDTEKLKKKFEKYKYARNFTECPLYANSMTEDEKRIGINAAKRWIENERYTPRQGSIGGEELRDNEFFKIIQEDYRKWYHQEYNVTPVDSDKVHWRNKAKTRIIDCPNIADRFLNRQAPPEFMDVLQDDAIKAINATIKLLSGEVYSRDDKFEMWAKNNYNEWFQQAMIILTTQKTGADDYRSEQKRYSWVTSGVKQLMEKMYRSSGKGAVSEEEFDPIENYSKEVKEQEDFYDYVVDENRVVSGEKQQPKTEIQVEELIPLEMENLLNPPDEYKNSQGKPSLKWLRMTKEEKLKIIKGQNV